MKIYEEKELFKPSFIQKIMNKVRVDNVTIEINNLFAKNEKNLENITLNQILEIANKYNVNLDLKYYQFRLDLFSSYLHHCLIDKKIDDAEINTLRHIQHILFLNEKDSQDLINQETEKIYDQETKEVVKDGLLDENEKEYLEKLKKDLGLSDDIAYKIYDQNATEMVTRLAQKAIEDERFSPDEEDEINQLIKNLKVEITWGEETKKALDVYRHKWQIENSGLSKFPSNISPTKSEKLSPNEIRNNMDIIFAMNIRGIETRVLETVYIIGTSKNIETIKSRYSFLKKIIETLKQGQNNPQYSANVQQAVDYYKKSYYDRPIQDYQLAIISDPNNFDLDDFYCKALANAMLRFCVEQEEEINAMKKEGAKAKRKEKVIETIRSTKEELQTECSSSSSYVTALSELEKLESTLNMTL